MKPDDYLFVASKFPALADHKHMRVCDPQDKHVNITYLVKITT